MEELTINKLVLKWNLKDCWKKLLIKGIIREIKLAYLIL